MEDRYELIIEVISGLYPLSLLPGAYALYLTLSAGRRYWKQHFVATVMKGCCYPHKPTLPGGFVVINMRAHGWHLLVSWTTYKRRT